VRFHVAYNGVTLADGVGSGEGGGGVREESARMGAIGGDIPVHWNKVDGSEMAIGGGGGAGKLEKILVSVRLRPLSDREIARGDPAEWECINDTTVISRSTFPDRPTAPTAYSFG
jgi:centromeric protein E